MKQGKVAEPNYDFEMTQSMGKDMLGRSFFTSEVSIIKCTRGEAIISINSRNHVFRAETNFILADAILFKVIKCSDDFTIRSFRFSLLFMNEIYPVLDNKVIDLLQFSAPDFTTDKTAESTELILQQLSIIYKTKNHIYRHRIAINLVLNYIYEIYEQIYETIDRKIINTSNYINYILDLFCVLCCDNHMNHRNIEYYAQRLNISSRYLYKITKNAFQSSPKQIIDYYVSGTAKKLLLTTIMTNQQISDKLNFPDQATFGQFFKRNVGIPPSEFRKKYR